MSNANDTQAQTGNETQEGADAPQYVTADQINQIVNSAVTNQLGRALKKELGGAIEAALRPIQEQMQSRSAEAPSDKSTSDKGKENPEFVALQKQFSDLKNTLAEREREVAQERQKAREDKAFSELVQSLSGKVRPGAEQSVAKILRADGQLIVGDDGSTSLRVRTSLFKGQAEDDHVFPLKDGLDHYLKTKDAAMFLPPPNGGAGTGNQAAPAWGSAQRHSPRYDAPPSSPEEKLARAHAVLTNAGVPLP